MPSNTGSCVSMTHVQEEARSGGKDHSMVSHHALNITRKESPVTGTPRASVSCMASPFRKSAKARADSFAQSVSVIAVLSGLNQAMSGSSP